MKPLYTVTLLIVAFVLVSVAGNAQANGDYRTRNNGNWNGTNVWQVYNAGNWTNTATSPTSANGAINIRDNIAVNVSVTVDQVTVSGGNLTVNNGFTLTVANGTSTDLQINAGRTVTRSNGGNIVVNTGALIIVNGTLTTNAGPNGATTVNGTIQNAGTVTGAANRLVFNAGSTYEHAQNGGTIPTVAWNANSTVNITGITNNAPLGLGQTFGNFTWNSTQTSDISLAAGLSSYNGSSVAGTLTIINTGTHNLRLLNSGATTTLNVGQFSQTGGVFYILGDGAGGTNSMTLDVAGNFSLTGGTLNINGATNGTSSGILQVGGNFTHTAGTLTESASGSRTGEIIFDGISAQTITGGGTVSNTINYTINNTSSTGITLNTPYTINNKLTLTDGLVYTNSTNILIIGSGGSVADASDASFVVGPIRKVLNGSSARVAGFPFPTGKEGAGYIPVKITNVSSDGTYEAELVPFPATSKGDKQGLSWIDPCQYWSLKKVSGSPSTATATVTMYWNAHSNCGSTSFVNDYTALRIARHSGNPAGEGTYWNTNGISSAPTGNNTSGFVNWSVPAASNITATTLFALGSTAEQPIPTPVKFGDIKAYVKDKGVQIDWDVYSEFNVARYEIERSGDGISFSYSGSVVAKNQDGKLYYNWFDATPLAGNNYYRIKNVDIDGKFEYSTIVKVSLDKLSAGVTIYPNPVRGNHISIQTAGLQRGNYKIEIFSAAGQQVYSKQFNHAGGNITQSVELPSTLQTGIYNMLLTGNGNRQTKSFLLQ